MKISLKNLDTAVVLMALFNNSKMQGMSFLGGDGSRMLVEEAKERLKSQTYFDYLNGKVMKVELGGEILETWLYDRDNGEGAALKAIQKYYPDINEMTESELLSIQAQGRVNRTHQNTKVTVIQGHEHLEGTATDTLIPLSKNQQKLAAKNLKALEHYKKTGKVIYNSKPKKHNAAKIEYHKGYFTVNGEVRKQTKKKLKN